MTPEPWGKKFEVEKLIAFNNNNNNNNERS